MKNLFSFDKRFGLLYEDTEVRKATFARYVYHPKHPSLGNRLSQVKQQSQVCQVNRHNKVYL